MQRSQWRVYKSQFVNHIRVYKLQFVNNIGFFAVDLKRLQRAWKWLHHWTLRSRLETPPRNRKMATHSTVAYSLIIKPCYVCKAHKEEFTVHSFQFTLDGSQYIQTPPTKRGCSWRSIFASVHERKMKSSVCITFRLSTRSLPYRKHTLQRTWKWLHMPPSPILWSLDSRPLQQTANGF